MQPVSEPCWDAALLFAAIDAEIFGNNAALLYGQDAVQRQCNAQNAPCQSAACNQPAGTQHANFGTPPVYGRLEQMLEKEKSERLKNPAQPAKVAPCH